MSATNNSAEKPWWVSSGPPTSDTPKFEIPKPQEKLNFQEQNSAPKNDSKTESENNLFGMSPATQTAAINTGLNLLSSFLDAISKPLNGEEKLPLTTLRLAVFAHFALV